MQEHTWPVDLGIGIGLQAQLEQSDEEGLIEGSFPEQSASVEEVAEFERAFSEGLPNSYREFLLHANGWKDFYFGLDLFGLAELQGSGRGQRAKELMESYDAEETFEDSELNASDILAVAAGDGADLVVIVREDRPKAGTVVWFDGGEYARYADFGEFFEHVLGMLQQYLDRRTIDTGTGPDPTGES